MGEESILEIAQRLQKGETVKDLRDMRGMGATVHGFRSTFSDWCTELTNFSAEVREMALAHTVSDKVEAAYRRGDLFEIVLKEPGFGEERSERQLVLALVSRGLEGGRQ